MAPGCGCRSRGTGLHAAILILVALTTACSSPPGSSRPPEGSSIAGYRVVGDIPLPGNTGRWDYQSLDATQNRLYIAHLGAGEVVVFDVHAQKVAGVVKNVASVHGVVAVPAIKRVFATATGRHELVAIDTDSLQVSAAAPAGDYPDGLDYVPEVGKVFVTDEQGTGDVVIDASTMKNVGSVKFGADIGNTKYDPVSKLVYVAVGSSNELVGIDPRSTTVVERTPLAGCKGAHGVQLTASPHRAFVGCQGSNSVVVFDFTTKRVMAQVAVAGTPDVLAYDPGLQRVYAASEDGTLAVIQATDPVRKLGQGNAGPNAHTVAIDPSSHLVYLPLTDVGGHPVLRVLSL